MRVTETASLALLSPQGPRSFLREFDFTLNPYGGCAFARAYCYVPSILHGRAEKLGGWGEYVEARVSAPSVLKRQAHKLAGKTFFCAAATDPWQPLEKRYEITRRLLAVLIDVPFRPATMPGWAVMSRWWWTSSVPAPMRGGKHRPAT